MIDLSESEKEIFDSLKTPALIQDFLNDLEMRTDDDEPIIRSPRKIMETRTASCIEGALFAVAVLTYHKESAYLLDLRVGPRTGDVDHVVAVFTKNDLYGALSKTNHSILRYREPVYKDARELAMSYFHEYFTDDGAKNLREFSDLFDICKKNGTDWITSDEDLYEIGSDLDDSPHETIVTPSQARNLRPADPVEIEAGKLTE